MPKKPKQPRKYFSLAEWYGEDLTKLSVEQKTANAELAISKKTKMRPCPFRPGRTCYKGGGVCTFRAYSREAASENIAMGDPVTVCPWRFFDGDEVFKWVGEVMLGTGTPRILGEIPFLQKLKPVGLPTMEPPDEDDDFIGRIDNILVHPSDTAGLNWCALELQAVYFSGKAMSSEFKEIQTNPGGVYFPVKPRHPDYRSSGPKRLLPQLQTKVPELMTWGKKMAVCVDEAFFAQLVGIEEVSHLSSAHIAWFVVRYELTTSGFRLRRQKVVFTKLDSTVKALTGGVPLPREVFEEQIRRKLESVG